MWSRLQIVDGWLKGIEMWRSRHSKIVHVRNFGCILDILFCASRMFALRLCSPELSKASPFIALGIVLAMRAFKPCAHPPCYLRASSSSNNPSAPELEDQPLFAPSIFLCTTVVRGVPVRAI